MSNKHHKSTNRKLKSHQTDKNGIILGSIVATIIAITPYLFYLYESVPETKVWDTFFFTYQSYGFEDVSTVMWLLSGKAIPLLLLFIWFFTCRHWWYHVILVPIAMYTYQIISLFNDDVKFVDEFQLLYLVPAMAIVIPSIYLIRARMFDKLNTANKSLEDLENEFKLSPTTFWGKLKEYF